MRELPRDLVTILRTEARNQRTPPIDYVIAEDGGRMVHRPEPDVAMAELLDDAATDIARLRGIADAVVYIADTQPFTSVGHVIEHLVPNARAALTAALSDQERAASRGWLVTYEDGRQETCPVNPGIGPSGNGIIVSATPVRSALVDVPVEPVASYFARQIEWSRETFGPALRTKGVIDHIRKELKEIEREPHDLSEWIDVVILAMDGFWRHGGKPDDLMPALLAKQQKNMARVWPDWRTMSEDSAIEHDRTHDASSAPHREGEDSAEVKQLKAEVERLRVTLTMSDADRRQWFISDLLGKRGHFRRSDIATAFSISIPQASNDIKRWLEAHPGAAIYNTSSKRYEVAATRSGSATSAKGQADA